MKALSVRQPWAIAIASGDKTVEVRSWKTNHRGPLLICASASPSGIKAGDNDEYTLPAGCVICVVNLTDVRPMTEADAEHAMCEFIPGAYAWVFTGEPQECEPRKIVGALGLFNAPDNMVRMLGEDESLFDFA